MRILAFIYLCLWAAVSVAGPYSDQLRTDTPRTGRMISEDGNAINAADNIRRMPINMARGKYPGARPFGSFGVRTVAAAETNIPVWPDGPAVIALPNLGAQMTVVSTSAADSSAGTNIRVLELHYLDRRLDPQVEDLIMQGVTPVLTQATDIRWIQCMHVIEFGTSSSAAGIITAKYAGNTFSQINVGEKRCTSSFRMVPRGKIAYIDGAVASSTSITADSTTVVELVASELDNHVYHDPLILMPFAGVGLQNGTVGFNFPPGVQFREGTLIGGIHTTSKAGVVTLSWYGRLEPAEDSEPLHE